MKFVLSLTLILTIGVEVSASDGVDPNPMNTPIRASSQNKIDISKILQVLQQELPETSESSSPSLTPENPNPIRLLTKSEQKLFIRQQRKLENLPKKKKKRLMRTLKKKVKQFNKNSQRKLFLGDIGGALGANGGAGAGMLGAGAGLMMATMGSDKEEAERASLETDLRSREMELMLSVNKRSSELGSLESKVGRVVTASYMNWTRI